MENITSQPNEKGFLAGFLKWLPVIQWTLTIIIAIGVVILSQRDSQTTQAQEVKETSKKVAALESTMDRRKEDRDRQFEQLRKEMLTRELYEAYHKNDAEKFERMEKMLEQAISMQNR